MVLPGEAQKTLFFNQKPLKLTNNPKHTSKILQISKQSMKIQAFLGFPELQSGTERPLPRVAPRAAPRVA